MTRTIWMSFADHDRPEGQRFLGVCVLDVSEHEAARAKPLMLRKHPHATAGAEWLYAAMQKSWALGINPGGSVASLELDADNPKTATVPRNRLLQAPDLLALGILNDGDDADTLH
jgi:hypothetical protein